jgi:hypothetical protein
MINRELSIEELKKVRSWSRKSGDLFKKARVLLSTLLLP